MGPIIPGQYAFGGFETVKSEGAGRDLLEVALADARLKSELAGIGLNNIGANLRQASVNDVEQERLELMADQLRSNDRANKLRFASQAFLNLVPQNPAPPDPTQTYAALTGLTGRMEDIRNRRLGPLAGAVGSAQRMFSGSQGS